MEPQKWTCNKEFNATHVRDGTGVTALLIIYLNSINSGKIIHSIKNRCKQIDLSDVGPGQIHRIDLCPFLKLMNLSYLMKSYCYILSYGWKCHNNQLIITIAKNCI